MSSQGDAQFDAALRAALAASDPLDDGSKERGAKQQADGKRRSKPAHLDEDPSDLPDWSKSFDERPMPTRPEIPTRSAPVDHPKGTRPTARAPRKPIRPKSRSELAPRRGVSPKLKAGAGLAGGLAMGAMTSGMDWKQAAQDPKAALRGLGGAALTQGKNYVAGMMDPANATGIVPQAGAVGAAAKGRATPTKGKSGGRGRDANGTVTATKALKEKTKALKADTKNLAEYAKTHRKMTQHVGKSTKSFNDLAKSHKESVGAQKNVERATKKWDKSQKKLNGAMGRSALGKIAIGIELAVAAVGLLITHWDTVKKVFDTVKKNVLDQVGNFFGSVFAACLAPFTSVIDGVKEVFSGLGSSIGGVFSGVLRQVAVIVSAIGSVVRRLEFKLPGWLGGANISLARVGDAMVSWAAAYMADGGMVRGPGGPRDDQVPIMASNGEFVVNAASTARHAALLESINKDTLHVSGRDAQVIASLGLSRVKPMRALPGLVATHRFDRATTINLTTTQHDNAYARSKAIAAQRDVTYASGRR